VEGRQKGRVVYPYNVDTANAIIESVCEGMTMRQISKMTGMPPVSTMYYWVSKYKEFKHDLEIARKVRGEMLADEALDIARDTNAMKSRADKLKIDTLKWAAKVNNPEQFGDKVTHSGDSSNPIQIVVDTGIKRD
jgi:transposase-like protein